MLRESKEIAVNVTTTAIVIGLGFACLGALAAILAREAYRDWRGTSTPAWLEDEPSGLDQL
jgi:hypothetical protein